MVQKMLWGERERERERQPERARQRENGEKLLLHPAVLDSPHLKTQLGQTGARSAVAVAVAWSGEEAGKEEKEGEST